MPGGKLGFLTTPKMLIDFDRASFTKGVKGGDGAS